MEWWVRLERWGVGIGVVVGVGDGVCGNWVEVTERWGVGVDVGDVGLPIAV